MGCPSATRKQGDSEPTTAGTSLEVMWPREINQAPDDRQHVASLSKRAWSCQTHRQWAVGLAGGQSLSCQDARAPDRVGSGDSVNRLHSPNDPRQHGECGTLYSMCVSAQLCGPSGKPPPQGHGTQEFSSPAGCETTCSGTPSP